MTDPSRAYSTFEMIDDQSLADRIANNISNILDLIEMSEASRAELNTEPEYFREWVALVAGYIINLPDIVTAKAAQRKLLDEIIGGAKRLRDWTEMLKKDYYRRAVASDLFGALKRTIEQSERLREEIPDLLEETGGRQTSLARKYAAIELAVELILFFGNGLPGGAAAERLRNQADRDRHQHARRRDEKSAAKIF